MTTATAAESARTGRPLAGWLCAAGGAAGVASGLVTAFVPPAVTMNMYRYPFSPGGYTAAQLVYAANHLMLLAGLLGIGGVRAGRWRGWSRWTPLALGVLVFVMVIPGLFGTFLEARLAITAWMLAWTALGVALLLDPGEIFLIRRRHLRQLRPWRHR
jgi:hypothetical protein